MIVGAAGKAGRAVHQHLAGLGHEIAACEVPYATIDELGSADYQAAFSQKALAQINVVRTGLAHVAERGSFTLISGIPSRAPWCLLLPRPWPTGPSKPLSALLPTLHGHTGKRSKAPQPGR